MVIIWGSILIGPRGCGKMTQGSVVLQWSDLFGLAIGQHPVVHNPTQTLVPKYNNWGVPKDVPIGWRLDFLEQGRPCSRFPKAHPMLAAWKWGEVGASLRSGEVTFFLSFSFLFLVPMTLTISVAQIGKNKLKELASNLRPKSNHFAQPNSLLLSFESYVRC